MYRQHTLGGKEKPFEWIYENRILKIIKESSGKTTTIKYSYFEILSLLLYLDNYGPLPLANSVTKLHDGIEKKGMGSFIYKNTEGDIVKAQSVSQLMPVLYELGLIEHDNKKRGMQFRVKNQEYLENLEGCLSGFIKQCRVDITDIVIDDEHENKYYKLIFEGIEKALTDQSEYDEAVFKEVFDPYKEFKGKMDELTDDKFYNILEAVVFYSGFKAATVNKYMLRINYYFNDYKNVLNYDDEFINSIIDDEKMLSNRSKIQACVKNAIAISKTVYEYGSVKDYIDSYDVVVSEDGMFKLIKNLRKRFSYLGEVTVFHLLTDLGFNVLKPDRVIMRIFKRLKLVENINDFNEAVTVGQKFAEVTGYPIRYIDIILVSYGQLDLEKLTSICTEANPKCSLCGVREYCSY